ncbi:hypothetical protein ACS0TY_005217 [Phlomoides rotata]
MCFWGFNMTHKMNMLKDQFPFAEMGTIPMLDLTLYGDGPRMVEEKKCMMTSNSLATVESDWSRAGKLSPQQVHFASLDALLNIFFARQVLIVF